MQEINVSETLKLPVDILSGSIAVHGIKGTGKTVTGDVLAEEALEAGVQTIVIDPTDVHWGLKSNAAGDGPGYPIAIFGGNHADLPLDETQGRSLAQALISTRSSAIISTRRLRKNAQKRLVTDLLEELYFLKGEEGGRFPLLLVIDEASQFAPQMSKGSENCLGAVHDVVRLGRSCGFGTVLIDQRPASVSKDVLSQCDTVFAHRLTGAHDRKALKDWFEGHDAGDHVKAMLPTLASLGASETGIEGGHCWVWSPGLGVFERIRVRMRKTFDSSRTPKMGEKPAIKPTAFADVDLDRLSKLIGSPTEDVAKDLWKENPAKDAEIRRLKAEIAALSQKSKVIPDTSVMKELSDRNAELKAEVDHLNHRIEHLKTIDPIAQEFFVDQARREGYAQAFKKAINCLLELEIASPDLNLSTTVENGSARRRTPDGMVSMTCGDLMILEGTKPERRTYQADKSEGDGNFKISGPQQAILDALLSLEDCLISQVDRSHAAIFSGASPNSSSFANNVSRLKVLGLIDYPVSGALSLTPAGRLFGSFSPTKMTLEELHNRWADLLKSRPQALILRKLIERYPKPISRELLAIETGASLTSSSFANNVSRLSSLGIACYPAKGLVSATSLLFPEGLK